MPKASPHEQERNQPEVRLRLAATGLKPNEVQGFAVRIVLGSRRYDAGKQESELERPPAPSGVALAAEVLHLTKHRPVGESESQCRILIAGEQCHAIAHPLLGLLHPGRDPPARIPIRALIEPVGLVTAPSHPRAVPRDEAPQQIERQVVACEALHFKRPGVAHRRDTHNRRLDLGQEVGPDASRRPGGHIPFDRRAMANGEGAAITVLELQFTLLVVHQGGIDARIVDDLTPLDQALEPDLEQRTLDALGHPEPGISVQIKSLPVEQGERQDPGLIVHTRAEVDPCTILPDLPPLVVAAPEAHRLRIEHDASVARSPEPARGFPVFGMDLVSRGRSLDAQTCLTAHAERKADRRGRHIAAAANRGHLLL